ncbi:MAG TPA: hypothetical protein VHZ07_20855 [Bryobacteraceae bacterium]|jgi:hypothetical protein|nr:hypothetical protein [Bryobacteraceae bacterium]
MAEPAALTASQLLEAEAERWEKTGEIDSRRKSWDGLGALRWWLDSKGALADGISPRLRAYYFICRLQMGRAYPGWVEELMRERDYCCICNETYRGENLSFCTNCTSLFGYCHSGDGGTAANGNPLCPVCRVGELAG